MKLLKIFALLIGLIGGLYIVYGLVFTEYHKTVENIVEQEFNGKIIKVEASRPGVVIYLSDDEMFRLPHSTNRNYDRFNLDEFIQISDSVYKRINNDTLLIIRNNDRYFFLLGRQVW